MTVGLSLRRRARESGDRPAWIDEDRELTWAQLASRVARVADELRGRGIAPPGPGSDRPPTLRVPVAVVGDRDLPTVKRILALMEGGIPFQLVHPRWTERQRERVLRAVGDPPLLGGAEGGDHLAETEVADEAPQSVDVPDDERALAVVPTSGSTGASRGVVLSRGAVLAAARASARRLGVAPEGGEGDRWLLSLPLAHVGGLAMIARALVNGDALVSGLAASFRPLELVERLRRHRVSMLSLVPTMLHRLVTAELEAPRVLRVVLVGGARAPVGLIARARALGWPVRATYGLSEAGSQVATETFAPSAEPDGSVGPPLDGFELRIGKRRGHGALGGEIEIRGPALFSGYHPAAEDSGDARDDHGWFATGDLGRLDARGHLWVTGRAGDLVISGGENVAPSEVEAEIETFPGVLQCCVVGLPDEEWGERVVAALVRDRSGPSDEAFLESLRAHLGERLAPFQRPRQLVIVDHLPSSASGKLDRHGLRAALQDGRLSALRSSRPR